jgi:hypothetical protein
MPKKFEKELKYDNKYFCFTVALLVGLQAIELTFSNSMYWMILA